MCCGQTEAFVDITLGLGNSDFSQFSGLTQSFFQPVSHRLATEESISIFIYLLYYQLGEKMCINISYCKKIKCLWVLHFPQLFIKNTSTIRLQLLTEWWKIQLLPDFFIKTTVICFPVFCDLQYRTTFITRNYKCCMHNNCATCTMASKLLKVDLIFIWNQDFNRQSSSGWLHREHFQVKHLVIIMDFPCLLTLI